MMFVIVALAACALGTFTSITIPAAMGRASGFLLLGVAGVSSLVAAVRMLRDGAAFITIGFAAAQTHLALRFDLIAAFFVGILGLIALLVSIYGLGPKGRDERRTGRTASASACAILFASLLACIADDVLLFIFAWELLALTFYWAIAYAGEDAEGPKAAYVTIVVTHVAGACIVAALLILAHAAGSFNLSHVVAAGSSASTTEAAILLILLLVGFGAKFGMLPLQVWMPYGYRAAPSVVTALMAGGALNVGFYGVARFIVGFPNTPLWFAILVIALGAITAFFGISWAAPQRDLRRLAAFSSVENGGIILAAFGVAIAANNLKEPMLVGFAIAAAFVQIAAHAVAKSTLFLSISSIGDACETTSLDRLGGLSRRMPIVAVVVLICGMSLAALPPLAGFVGEWLVLELLMQAFRTGNIACEVTFAIAGAIIGVAAGVSIVTFTKVVGIGMLGAARSSRQSSENRSASPMHLVALAFGAACVFAVGVLAAGVLRLIGPSVDGIARAPATEAMIGSFPLIQPAFANFSSISPPGIGVVLCGFTLGFWILARLFPRPQMRKAAVWTSGEPFSAWNQYTGTGYSNPTRVIFDAGVRTVRQMEAARGYTSDIRPYFDLPFYEKLAKPFLMIADLVRATQSGVIAAYLSYILAFTILMLLLFPSIRHW